MKILIWYQSVATGQTLIGRLPVRPTTKKAQKNTAPMISAKKQS